MSRRLLPLLLDNSIVVVLVVLCAGLALWHESFLTAANWANILNNLSVTGIVAMGVALVVIAGGIDLSFGSILASCAVLAAWLQPQHAGAALLLPPLLGACLGACNGALVAGVGANPLITTLGTQWLFAAALMIVTGGQLVQSRPDGFLHFVGNGRVLGLPFPVWLLGATAVLAWFLSRRSVFGTWLYAHGSNEKGLRFAGVRSKAVYLGAFVAMGFLVGVAGVLLAARLGGVRPTAGEEYLINVLTAVLLGGVSLSGGVGSVFHVLAAVVVLAVLDNAMVLLGVPIADQRIVKGVVFILSVLYGSRVVARLAGMHAAALAGRARPAASSSPTTP